MSEGVREEERDCLVVGAGLAGLACAHRLVTAGRRVTVVEAGDEPGGRARTVMYGGRPVDRGFQVLLSGYRRTRALAGAVGIGRRDLRPIAAGAVFVGGEGHHRLALRPGSALMFGGLPVPDRLRMARLVTEVALRPPDGLLREGHELSAEELLRERGFSDRAIERFFRPLFGVITLDRSLGADAGYFRYLLAMLARGPALIPSDGLGMIADWTAASVEAHGGEILTEAAAVGLEVGGAPARVESVRLADGRRLRARAVVLAVDAPRARELLEPVDPASAARIPGEAASSVTAAFALSHPLYGGRAILLDAEPHEGDGPRVDLICQTSNITRPGTEEAPHILLATSVTTQGGWADGLEDAVGATVARWVPGFDWARHSEPIGVYEHRFAQFRPLPGVRRELPGPRTARANLILAGDLTTHPSIEGAVTSGERAAEIAEALAS